MIQYRKTNIYSQFKYEHHLVIIFESIVKVDQFPVVQLVHDVDLLLDELLLHSAGDRDELRGEVVAGGSLAAPVHDAESACAYNIDIHLMPPWFSHLFAIKSGLILNLSYSRDGSVLRKFNISNIHII